MRFASDLWVGFFPVDENFEASNARARVGRLDDDWSPSDEPYLPGHLRAQILAEIRAGKARLAARQAEFVARKERQT